MKVNTWDQNLMRYIDGCRDKPFEWGVFDCTVFVRGACEAQLGVDPFVGQVPEYKTLKGAKGSYSRLVARDVVYQTILNRVLEPHEGVLPPRGSVVARRGVSGAGEVLGAALGVVVSRHVAFVGESGLEFYLSDPNDEAWLVE